MADSIKQLTQKQIDFLPVQRDKWLSIGMSTKNVDFEKAKEAVIECYKIVNLKIPEFFYFFDSPISAAIGTFIIKSIDNISKGKLQHIWDNIIEGSEASMDEAAMRTKISELVGSPNSDPKINDRIRDYLFSFIGEGRAKEEILSNVRDMVYGCHDASWLGFYDTFIEFGVKDIDIVKPLIELAKVVGWWAPYENVCVLQNRPSVIRLDDRKQLHCENGAAIEYRDGFKVYAWHGMRIPSEWIEDKESLTPAIALKVPNMEQRRCACEIVGWSKILRELNAKTIDKHANQMVGELLEVTIPDVGKEKFLRVMCGTAREFALPVPPNVKTAEEAQRWLNFIPDDISFIPEIRT